jgi:two-component system KDP operon response regulator KdpE
MERIRILITGDDIDFAEHLRPTLSAEGYEVLIASGNDESLWFISEYHPDLILFSLDQANSNANDIEFCKEARYRSRCPIIVLSERNDDENWINVLTTCADNYLVKPFTNDWLLAVMRASLRLWLAYKKGKKIPDKKHNRKELVIENDAHKVHIRGERINLTPLEFTALLYLAKNDGRVISHEELMLAVWGTRNRVTSQLRSLIYQIRQKIEKDPTKPEYIITVPGFGYRLISKEPVEIN